MKTKKKGGRSEEVLKNLNQSGNVKKKLNLFDLKINRTKSKVINRKSKDDVGRPGVSKLKSMTKRNFSLLREYKNKKKANILIDCRIGEKSSKLSEEAKKVLRFAAERRKQAKGNLFNLDDDFEEQLTHGGKSLTEHDLFEDNPLSDEEEEEQGNSRLKDKFVSEAHFGGFLTKKDDSSVDKNMMSRKEWIDHIVAESKKRKADRLKDKEYVQKVQIEMDEKYKDLSEVINTLKKNDTTEEPKMKNAYDSLLMELKFDMSRRATAKERIKSEEEIILKEKRKLEELERERLESMKVTARPNQKHQSADALDDDLFLLEDSDGNKSEEEPEPLEEGIPSEPVPETRSTPKADSFSRELKEVPYVIEVPQTYADLCALLKGHSPFVQGVILERMVKCNHPSLDVSNMTKLQTLLEMLLEYSRESRGNNLPEKEQFGERLSVVGFHIIRLVHLCQDQEQPFFNLVEGSLQACLNENSYPDWNTVFLLHTLMKTSPRSTICQALILYMCHILTDLKVKSRSDLSVSLFMVTTLVQYLEGNNKYCPEVIKYMEHLLESLAGVNTDHLHTIHLPLLPQASLRALVPRPLDLLELKNESEVDDQFRINVFLMALTIVRKLHSFYILLSSSKEIFSRILSCLKSVDSQKYPTVIKDSLEDIISMLDCSKTLSYLQMEKAKPKLLRLYEPKFDMHYDGNKRRNRGTLGERQKFMHKYKKEMKGALREIRKDNSFLSKVKLDEQRMRDQDRKDKVKRLTSLLSSQEGDFQKLKRKAGKLK